MTPDQRAKIEALIPRPANKSPEWHHGFDWAVDLEYRRLDSTYREEHGVRANWSDDFDDYDRGVEYAQAHPNYQRLQEAFD